MKEVSFRVSYIKTDSVLCSHVRSGGLNSPDRVRRIGSVLIPLTLLHCCPPVYTWCELAVVLYVLCMSSNTASISTVPSQETLRSSKMITWIYATLFPVWVRLPNTLQNLNIIYLSTCLPPRCPLTCSSLTFTNILFIILIRYTKADLYYVLTFVIRKCGPRLTFFFLYFYYWSASFTTEVVKKIPERLALSLKKTGMCIILILR